MRLVDKRLFIDAPPARVYELLTDAQQLIEWMAPVATADSRPGGTISWTHENGDSVVGTFVELVPYRRIVFTYGWDRADVGIPPASTQVEINLRPRNGGTDLHLIHRGLTDFMAEAHSGGWDNYLGRLAAVAEGRDPGPDLLAGERVPARPSATSEERFWALARPLLQQAGVTRSTMMGFACLRLDGDFFAACDHRSGQLVVKLNEERVSALLDVGKGESFAPNGRPFREWVTIPEREHRSWGRLLDEALQLSAMRRST